MKRLLIIAALTLLPASALALSPAYRHVYCYPTGTYWVKQLSNPWNASYYASHNAALTAEFGAATQYCPS